jgi:hypothetical protein
VEARFRAAAADPAANQFRSEVDGHAENGLEVAEHDPEGAVAVQIQTPIDEMSRGIVQILERMSALERKQNSFQDTLESLARLPLQVNLNTTARSNANLALIDVPMPSDQAQLRALARDTVTLSGFLKRKFSELELSSEEKHLARSKVSNAFGHLAKLRKLASGSLEYAGQINRAQVHYRLQDLPLLEGVWDETEPLRRYVVAELRARVL